MVLMAGKQEIAMGNTSDETNIILSSISKEEDIIFGVIYSMYGVLSVFGNSILLFVAYRNKHTLKPAEYFIINLAISDLGMVLTLLPLAIPSSFAHRWLFGHGTCIYYAFCGVLFGICSLTNLTVLGVVCCMKICYPAYGNRFTSEYAYLLMTFTWAYASIFAISPLANWGHYGLEPYGTACCIDWNAPTTDSNAMSYIVALFVFCYVFPCCIITTSYTLILLTIKGSRRAVQQHVSSQTTSSNVHNLIVKLSVAVCIGFLIAWTPYAITAMWAAFGNSDKVPPLAFALSAIFAKSSTLHNPIIHLLFKPNFRKCLNKGMAHLLNLCSWQNQPCNRGSDLSLKSARDQIRLNSCKRPSRFVDLQDAYNTCSNTFESFSNHSKSQSPGGSTCRDGADISSDNSTTHSHVKTTTFVMVTTNMTSSTGHIEAAIDKLPIKLGTNITLI
ncbi:opsin-5-like isoform X1 [Chiloscyllium plagiosum]|uniref:opsin-5-like isoform X1 n=1 Tax=Chiloscyllium plagiosum TaxID=36176 RepID=UPI001CB7C44B|nr:opsin-5-like isoform X1 [Chiloscyllium plagiosum]